MSASPIITEPSYTLLRAHEVAIRLDISKSMAYQLMQQGEIPTVRFRGSVRVLESDLNEYIHRHWSGWNS